VITYQRKVGTVDVSVVIRIIDSTDGTPETGVVWNTAGIDLQYRREGEASTAIVEATLAALTTAHTDGGFLHIGNGYYRLDLPDAACAAGAVGVLIHGIVTGMVVIGCYIQLVAVDPFDTVRMGLTALPSSGTLAVNPILNATQTGVTIPTVTALTNAPSDSSGVTTLLARIVGTLLTGNHNPQTGDAFARLGLPAGASVSADVAAVKSDSAAILADTGTDGVVVAAASKDGYALSAAGVQAIWDALTSALIAVGSIGKKLADWVVGSLNADQSAVTVGTVTITTTATNLTNAPTVGDLTAAMKTSVNAEVLDVINVDTFAEPGQEAPAATNTLAKKIGYLFKFLRNKVTQDATTLKVYADDGITVDQKSTVSDDATTYTRGEIESGL